MLRMLVAAAKAIIRHARKYEAAGAETNETSLSLHVGKTPIHYAGMHSKHSDPFVGSLPACATAGHCIKMRPEGTGPCHAPSEMRAAACAGEQAWAIVGLSPLRKDVVSLILVHWKRRGMTCVPYMLCSGENLLSRNRQQAALGQAMGRSKQVRLHPKRCRRCTLNSPANQLRKPM